MTISTQPRPYSSDDSSMPTGAEILVRSLVREGVDVVFAYPGGASLPIHQALSHEPAIRTILPRHEQGGAFAAEGYGRSTGRAGVCISTSGPGATNMLTPIADAYMDSTPMVAITAQVPTGMIGSNAFQETDVFCMSAPVVKHSYMVTDAGDISRVVREAFHLATSGRPGPVLIDIPKDCLEKRGYWEANPPLDLSGYHAAEAFDEVRAAACMDAIVKARKPVILAGGGLVSPEASRELRIFAERFGIPVVTTIMGIGVFPEEHPLSLRWAGMHGSVFANKALHRADLVLALGTRFSDRVTGNASRFCNKAEMIHVDLDASELNKNKKAHHALQADAGAVLGFWNRHAPAKAGAQPGRSAWLAEVEELKEKFPFSYPDREGYIAPQSVVEELYRQTREMDPFITTGVGQHQMFTAQFYRFAAPRRFATSGGLGSMGYGLPAAMGVQAAHPGSLVVNVDGDGSFLMNIQELATVRTENLPVKSIILNNQHLGMVVQWEDLKYDSNRAQTFLADPGTLYDPTHRTPSAIYPDFPAICGGFGIPCERVYDRRDLPAAVARMLAAEGPYVLDVMVPHDVHVLPMIPGGMGVQDVILERIAGDGNGRRASELGKVIPTAL